MSSIWTTLSSKSERVEDPNPEVWYEAAKNATSYESAMYYYNKAEKYLKNDNSGYSPDWFLKEKIYFKFHKNDLQDIAMQKADKLNEKANEIASAASGKASAILKDVSEKTSSYIEESDSDVIVFFDTLGSKIKNAGQNIAQTTKNFADVTAYKNNISDCEKQITELYTIVGKAYYEHYKNNSVPETKENIIKINFLFRQIGELKQQIEEIERRTKCPNCGKDIPGESMFCNNCGYKIPKEPEDRRCSNCGKPLSEHNNFCTKCGTKVD